MYRNPQSSQTISSKSALPQVALWARWMANVSDCEERYPGQVVISSAVSWRRDDVSLFGGDTRLHTLSRERTARGSFNLRVIYAWQHVVGSVRGDLCRQVGSGGKTPPRRRRRGGNFSPEPYFSPPSIQINSSYGNERHQRLQVCQPPTGMQYNKRGGKCCVLLQMSRSTSAVWRPGRGAEIINFYVWFREKIYGRLFLS